VVTGSVLDHRVAAFSFLALAPEGIMFKVIPEHVFPFLLAVSTPFRSGFCADYSLVDVLLAFGTIRNFAFFTGV